MIGHPDADTLAACREGLLGRRRSARIRAHLARCSRCASLDRELAAVTTLLGSVPAPRIPDQVAARLDTVLAAESAARARGQIPATADGVPATADGVPATAGARAGAADGSTGPAGRPGPRPRQPRSARPPRPWRVTALRAASVTAVLLIIAGGGYGVSRLLHTSGGGASSSASGASGSASRAGPAVKAPGEGPSQGPVSPRRAGLLIPAGQVQVVHSDTDYQPGQLVAQAQAVLARHPPRPGSRIASLPSTTTTGCVRQFALGAPPTLVDEALYRGQPATIIIRAPSGVRPGHVWVIVPSCSAAGRQLVKSAALPASR